MSVLNKFNQWLSADDPAALVIREWLMPVEGPDGVVFPATFAPEQGSAPDRFPGGYNIDPTVGDGQDKDGNPRNVCLIDSVGSQANRIELLFLPERHDGKYSGLVPQVIIRAGDKAVNLLEAGHRAGDAIVRCSALQKELQDAFKAVLMGNAEPLARIAPTSLVFGVWDSRDTQAKLPRLMASTIRAFDVRKLTRSAQYGPPVDYAALEVFTEEEKAKAEGDKKSPLAKRGFVHVPASGSHGGVIATGGIRRNATLSLAALRLLAAGKDEKKKLALRRYILGLALTAFTYPPAGYLRQGCQLVIDSDKPRVFEEVYGDGRRVPSTVTHDDAVAYAKAAAEEFGVAKGREVEFDKKAAKEDVKKKDK